MSAERSEPWRASSASGATTSRPPLSVLFIDPDVERVGRLVEHLRQVCTVESVTTARDAAGVIARHVPDLIILDLDLPDVGSIEFITYLHRLAATRHTLIMVVSRRATVREKIAALSAGADDYVVWPMDPETFLLHVQLLGRFRRTLQW